jgi:hypothetical protein
MTYQFRKWHIPGYMMPAVERYVKQGQPVGDFLQAVISNDLSRAVGFADDANVENLPAFLAYLHNEAPSECFGSPEKYKAWIAKHKEKDHADT